MNNVLKRELIYYIIIGTIVVLVDFLSYHFYYSTLSIDISNSKKISYITGGILSFFLKKIITFKSSKKNISEPLLFSIVYFLGFIFNSITHDLTLKFISGNYPFYLATVVSVGINYLGQKFIVFKKK